MSNEYSLVLRKISIDKYYEYKRALDFMSLGVGLD